MTWHVVTEEGYVHSEHPDEASAVAECERANGDTEADVAYRVVERTPDGG